MKKKTVPPRKARRAPAAPKAPFRLEVGKTYENTTKSMAAKITAFRNGLFYGVYTRGPTKGREDTWQPDGAWLLTASIGTLALVREVPGAKRPDAKRRVPKSSSKKGSVQ